MAHKLVLTFFLNQLTGRYYLPIALYLAQISLVLIEFEATAAFRGHIAGTLPACLYLGCKLLIMRVSPCVRSNTVGELCADRVRVAAECACPWPTPFSLPDLLIDCLFNWLAGGEWAALLHRCLWACGSWAKEPVVAECGRQLSDVPTCVLLTFMFYIVFSNYS